MAMSKDLKIAFSVIVVFFLGLFVAVGVTIRLAVKDHEPVIDENYYERGLLYENEAELLRRAEDEKWVLQSEILDQRTMRPGEREVSIKIFSETGVALTGADVTVKVELPASVKYRKIHDFKPVEGSPGLYTGRLNLPNPGMWEIVVKAEINNNAMVVERRRVTAG